MNQDVDEQTEPKSLEISEETISLIQDAVQTAMAKGYCGLVINYHGSGDSGGMEDWKFLGEDGEPTSTPPFPAVPVVELRNLDALAPEVLFAVIEDAGLSGWENDGGGGGSLELMNDGRVLLRHYHFETDEDTDTQTFDLTADVGPPLPKPQSSAVDYKAYSTWKTQQTLCRSHAIGAVVLPILRDHGWIARAEYSGSCDSSDVVSCWCEPCVDGEPCVGGTTVQPDISHIHVEIPGEEDGSVTVSLDTAIEELLWTVIDRTGHSGWEDNDGGRGELRLDASGSVTLEHSDWLEESVDSYYGAKVAISPLVPQYEIDYAAVAKMTNSKPWAEVF